MSEILQKIDSVFSSSPQSATKPHCVASFSLKELDPIRHTHRATISYPAALIDLLFENAARNQQKHAAPVGFSKTNVPLCYVKQNYRLGIIEHIKEFLFKFEALNFLYQQINDLKITIAGEPILVNIHVEPEHDAHFYFDIVVVQPFILQEQWKFLPFKSPRRKNYKDLDRQADNFIAEETALLAKSDPQTISLRDWINITVYPFNQSSSGSFTHLSQNFWFKMGDEDIESLLRELFVGQKKGSVSNTTNRGLQDYFSDTLNANYDFKVVINDIVPHAYFCFEQFKNYFRIKTNKDMHKKLIEVFSYRNDISQRRSIVEESLSLLLSKHRIEAPKHLVSQQKENILSSIRQNPDYTVYRKQNDFNLRVDQLANRQVKEILLADQLAYAENITVSDEDIKGYLNLTKRNRTRDFLHFDVPNSKRDGQEILIPESFLKKVCLREKTVNYIIYHLTKK